MSNNYIPSSVPRPDNPAAEWIASHEYLYPINNITRIPVSAYLVDQDGQRINNYNSIMPFFNGRIDYESMTDTLPVTRNS